MLKSGRGDRGVTPVRLLHSKIQQLMRDVIRLWNKVPHSPCRFYQCVFYLNVLINIKIVSLRSFLEIIFSLYTIHQTVGNIVINVMDSSALKLVRLR